MRSQHQYVVNASTNLNNRLASGRSTDGNERNIQEIKKFLPLPTVQSPSYFSQVLPCIRRLYTVFDSVCPNIYRLHCSDSLRILNEIICLTNEYLHVSPSSTINTNDLLYNDKDFDEFISKIRRPSLIRKRYYPIVKNELHCFGKGIQASDNNNQLNQTLLFCFELTSETIASSSVNIVVADPNERPVPIDIKYINTYDKSTTKLYSCSYKPTTDEGIYKVSFYQNNTKMENQQYFVPISRIGSNNICQEMFGKKVVGDLISTAQKETPEYELEGDGCSTNVIINSIARFRLRIKSSKYTHYNSKIDLFSISIHDPFGNKIVVQRRVLAHDLIEFTYQPMSIGEHQLILSFDNKICKQLTIGVINDESNSFSKFKVFGPGVKRAIVGLPTEFYIDLYQKANSDNIHFRLEPSYEAEMDYEQQLATVRYVPTGADQCPINILENDKDIYQSPFIAQIDTKVLLHERPRIRVIGLSKQIILYRPVEFQVYVDNPFEDLNNLLHIEILTDDENSPSVTIRRRHRSSYSCSFTPVTLGRHILSIDYAGIVAEQNPFYSQAIQEKDIILSGPAMNNQCLTLNEPTYFCFALRDISAFKADEKCSTSESGYSSNEDVSSSSSSSSTNNAVTLNDQDENNYRVTITDSHGNKKSNVLVREIMEKNNENNVRVDFTPNEQILYINISCTW